jgi:hypothetical protein
MPTRMPLASLVASMLSVLLISTGCAHAPAGARSAARDPAAARARELRDPAARAPDDADAPQFALVTGSLLPQPIGRNGVPLTISPVRVIEWRGSARQGSLSGLRFSDPAFRW